MTKLTPKSNRKTKIAAAVMLVLAATMSACAANSGTGSVNFAAYLKALENIGYRRYLTIERAVGDAPEKDIVTAANFLNKVIADN